MNLSIGEKIKQLRKQNDVTQEKLAEYLNISYQAISKWENGTALPDITMVIPIANFFGVSADELFGLDNQMEYEDIKEYEKKQQYYKNHGFIMERLALCRNMAAKYPKNYQILLDLAYALYHFWDYHEEELNEVIVICERIRADCLDDNIRSCTLQLLAFTHCELDNEEKAIEYAGMASGLHTCREVLLERSYIDKDKIIEQCQNNILQFLDLLYMSMSRILHTFESNEQKIFAYETILKMWNAIIYDGNFLFYHTRIANIYNSLAVIYAKMKDKEKTLENLELAKKHALAYDSLPDEIVNYTGIFTNKTTFNPHGISKKTTGTEIDEIQYNLEYNYFDFIRNDPDFIVFEQSIKNGL